MDVREMRAGDGAAAIALWEAAGLTRPWNDANADFERAVAGPTSAVLGGFVGEDLVATAMVGFDGHRGWMYYVATAAALRGQGAGRGIVAAAEEWLRRRGATKVNLMVRGENGPAAGFYEHIGYEPADAIVLARWL